MKIDKTFAQSLEASPSDRDIISAIMGIARGMGFSVTAEGIETPRQLTCLQNLGCDFGQGNLFAEPLDAGRLEQWLQAGTGDDSLKMLKTSFPIRTSRQGVIGLQGIVRVRAGVKPVGLNQRVGLQGPS